MILCHRHTPVLEPYLKLVIVLVAVGLGGCMTPSKTDKIMNSWIGHYGYELTAIWGTPTGERSDGNGGRILIYDESSDTVFPAMHPDHGVTELSVTRTRMFWVQPDGTIYRCTWQGLTAADKKRGYRPTP